MAVRGGVGSHLSPFTVVSCTPNKSRTPRANGSEKMYVCRGRRSADEALHLSVRDPGPTEAHSAVPAEGSAQFAFCDKIVLCRCVQVFAPHTSSFVSCDRFCAQ